MKRSFRDIDLSLPTRVLETRPDVKQLLDRINTIETRVDDMIIKKKRMGLAFSSEPCVNQKILRVFVYNKFVKATKDDRAHFMVHIDGMLLDTDRSSARLNMAMFFDKVVAQVDKKFNQGMVLAEWDRNKFPQGTTTDGFAIKIYHDKIATCKIFLHRNSDVRERFELSAQLRSLIPVTSIACTEEEAVLNVWQCLSSRSSLLFDPRDKKIVRCDEVRAH